jgi:hypothetical protein
MSAVVPGGSYAHDQVGFYTYTVGEGAWSWTDGIYLLHGYAPREVPATTEVFLRHKHPEDRSRAQQVLEDAIRTGRSFSCYHRIVDRRGQVRFVLSVGHGVHDAAGDVVRIEGFFVDLTQVRRDETQAEVESALERIGEHRAAIEQAKGMVMLATGCEAQAAFDVLRGYSQHLNVKLNVVARQLIEAAREMGGTDRAIGFLQELGAPGSVPEVQPRPRERSPRGVTTG